MVSVAEPARKNVYSMMANLRSDGLVDGLRSTYGLIMNPTEPMIHGTVTPAIWGSKYDSNSCKPRKYHGAFDGLGVALKLAGSRSGACRITDRITRNAVIARSATNSISIRCGHVLTLSVGSGLTCWIARALTTVRRR